MFKFIDVVTDQFGNVKNGVSVVVTSYPSHGGVTVYTDDGITPATASTVTTDATGTYFFFANPGRYYVTGSYNGSQVFDKDITVPDAAASVATSTAALSSATTVINVSSATAPTTGQVLTATDATHATWQTPASVTPGSLYYKDAVKAATVGTETYTVVSGSVTQISGTSVDGITLSVNDRLLIKDAPAASGTGSPYSFQTGNGIYTVTNATTNLTLTRATDCNSSTNCLAGMTVRVQQGNTNAELVFTIITDGAITPGSTQHQWGRDGDSSGFNSNVFIGNLAALNMSGGGDMVAIGYKAFQSATNAGNCTAVGSNALASLVNNGNNTAVGSQTGKNITGSDNTAIGAYALSGASNTATRNAAFGVNSQISVTSGGSNATFGWNSGATINSGNNNAIFGNNAGNTISTGSVNTIIGASADVNSSSASNRTAIGSNAVCNTDNTCKIGDSNLTALNFHGNATKIIGLERNTNTNTAGSSLQLKAGSATSGATNQKGGIVQIFAGGGTGNADAAAVTMVGCSSSPTSGTTDQTFATKATYGSNKIVPNNTATSIFSLDVPNNSASCAIIDYGVEVFNGTDLQVEVGQCVFSITNKGNTIANNVATKLGNQQAATTGTLTVTFTITAANPALVQVNANSSLTPSTGYPRVSYNVRNMTPTSGMTLI